MLRTMPLTSKAACGVLVPMPNRKLAASQNRFAEPPNAPELLNCTLPTGAAGVPLPPVGVIQATPRAAALEAVRTCPSVPTGTRAFAVEKPKMSPLVVSGLVPGGAIQVAFSHRNRADPAVAPGSGTRPTA